MFTLCLYKKKTNKKIDYLILINFFSQKNSNNTTFLKIFHIIIFSCRQTALKAKIITPYFDDSRLKVNSSTLLSLSFMFVPFRGIILAFSFRLTLEIINRNFTTKIYFKKYIFFIKDRNFLFLFFSLYIYYMMMTIFLQIARFMPLFP